MPGLGLSLLWGKFGKLQFPQERVRKAEELVVYRLNGAIWGDSGVFSCPGGSGQLVSLDSLPHTASAVGTLYSCHSLWPWLVLVALGGCDRQWSPHGVCCWHPCAHSLFFQSHNFQYVSVWGPNWLEAGVYTMWFRVEPGFSTGRRRHRLLHCHEMTSHEMAWFSRGGEQFLSQESEHILEEFWHFKGARSP